MGAPDRWNRANLSRMMSNPSMRSSRLPGNAPMPVHRQWTNRWLPEKTPGSWQACRSPSRIFFVWKAHRPRQPRASWQILPPPIPPHRLPAWSLPGESCWARLTWTSSPMALPMNPRHFSQPRAIPGIPPVCRVVHQAVPLPAWLPGKRRSPLVPTPPDPSASLLHFAAWWG